MLSTRSAPPSTKRYRQKLPKGGYGYLTTRDGTKLAINVQLPSGPGPFPTLVEYSGYGYADPDGGESSIAAIAKLLGYAVVDVNMRGTGCSGGAFDYFEPLQGLDGYDVIETVARQSWVARGKVGMVGLSYGGISQLFVAATRPPSLSAITPLSVIDDTATTLYPGGILNTGFALSWAKDRVHDGKPASATGGQPWALKRIRAGDKVCKRNQAPHAEAVDLIAKSRANSHYVPKVADPLAPVRFVNKIQRARVPRVSVDGRTDGRALPDAPAAFHRDFAQVVHVHQRHAHRLARPGHFQPLVRLPRALRRGPPPAAPAGVRDAAPLVFKAAMGIDGVTLPDDPIQAQPTFEAARAAFEALPPVRILFDNGAGSGVAGAPYAGFERSFARFPVPGTSARSWYLGAGGALVDAAPAAAGVDRFTWSRTARPPTNFTGNTSGGVNGLWTATPPYAWSQNPPGTALSYVTEPLAADTAVVGGGALEAWIRSTSRDLDLQATVSEIRPDGLETFVQSGWLRASARKLDARRSTALEPVLSLRRKDRARLPKAGFAKVTVPLYYQGHVYRAGSRVRVTLAAPRGDQPVWRFGELRPARGGAKVTVSRSREASVAAGAAGRGGGRCADRAAAVSWAARRAVPTVRGVG